MAVTASIALGSSTLYPEQQTTATLTVSNSGGAAVLVTGIQPTCTPSGLTNQAVAVALGNPPFGGAFNQSVAASGSTTFSFGVVAHAPTSGYGLAEPSQQLYSVGATVYTNDGSVTVATPSTLTINSPSHT
jgi:hypothetical protein